MNMDEVSMKHIILFVQQQRILTGLLTDLRLRTSPRTHSEIF